MFKNLTSDQVVSSLDDCRILDEITHYNNYEGGGMEWIVRAYLDIETDSLRFVCSPDECGRKPMAEPIPN